MPPRLSPSLAAALISSIIACSAAASKQRTSLASTRSRSPGPGRSAAFDAARADAARRGDDRRRRARRSSALATAPAATRAAVSRAEARSSTSRASSKPYFCMPARSAWPGRGWVSGAAVGPSSAARAHLLLPLVGIAVPLGVADLDGHRRAERAAVADAADEGDLVLLEAHARARGRSRGGGGPARRWIASTDDLRGRRAAPRRRRRGRGRATRRR